MSGDGPAGKRLHAQPRLSTAGRLLAALTAAGSVELAELGRQLGVGVQALERCRQGLEPLEPETQMRLAALTLLVAPEHGRLARTLYGQAQAALRVQLGEGVQHKTYPKEFFH